MNLDQWTETYKPKQNHLSEDEAFDNTLFETYGDELAAVVAQADPPGFIWTLVDEDGKQYVSAGMRRVNRVGYFICEVAYDPANPPEDVDTMDEDDYMSVDIALQEALPYAAFAWGWTDEAQLREELTKYIEEDGNQILTACDIEDFVDTTAQKLSLRKSDAPDTPA